MARLVLVTDVHYTRTAPECRAASYPREVLAKLHQAGQVAAKLKADAIGCCGDWFHRKGRATHAEANDLLAVLASWRALGLDVLGILGNHDIAGHSLESLDERASGALVHSQLLHLLDDGYWSRDGMAVTGTSYFNGTDDTDESRIRTYGAERPDGARVHVHLAHGALMLSGDFFEAHTKPDQLLHILTEAGRCPDVIVCGHLHFPEGVREFTAPDGRKVTLVRPGSTSRVSSDDVVRQPQATVVASAGERYTVKLVPIGQPVVHAPQDLVAGEAADTRTPEEHAARIADFVKQLREEADAFDLADWRGLIGQVAEKLNVSGRVRDLAVDAVNKRQ